MFYIESLFQQIFHDFSKNFLEIRSVAKKTIVFQMFSVKNILRQVCAFLKHFSPASGEFAAAPGHPAEAPLDPTPLTPPEKFQGTTLFMSPQFIISSVLRFPIIFLFFCSDPFLYLLGFFLIHKYCLPLYKRKIFKMLINAANIVLTCYFYFYNR